MKERYLIMEMWLLKICELCDEYRQLGGLEDAKRASDIPEEIIEIVEKELQK